MSVRRLLCRFCWLLEDIADKILGEERAYWFYPSSYFEKPQGDLIHDLKTLFRRWLNDSKARCCVGIHR